MADANGSPPNHDVGPDYRTVAVGLIAASTALVSVTVAAYAALALQKINNFDTGLGQMGVLGAISSAFAYLMGVLFCLTTLKRPTAALQLREISRATSAFFVQASSAGILALVVMAAPVFTGTCLNPGSATTPSVQQETYEESLNDARLFYAQAIESLGHGHVRDAAALAWLSTVRATDAVLATDAEYAPTGVASRTSRLNDLAEDAPMVEGLATRYRERANHLRDACSSGGVCGPDIEVLVRETEQYINHAAVLGRLRMPSE